MKQLLFIACLLLSFASCTKSSTSATENNEILRSGKWALAAYTVKYTTPEGLDIVGDVYRGLDTTCRKDDYILFGDNYKGEQNSGKLNCFGELEKMPFDWKLTDNQKTLVMNNAQYTIGFIPLLPGYGKDYVEAKIIKINKKSFTITYDMKEEPFNVVSGKDTGFFSDTTYYFTQTFNRL